MDAVMEFPGLDRPAGTQAVDPPYSSPNDDVLMEFARRALSDASPRSWLGTAAERVAQGLAADLAIILRQCEKRSTAYAGGKGRYDLVFYRNASRQAHLWNKALAGAYRGRRAHLGVHDMPAGPHAGGGLTLAAVIPGPARAHGLLVVFRRGQRAFSNADRELMESIAALLALALDHAALREHAASAQGGADDVEPAGAGAPLPPLTLLLDADGFIVRANRALESWGLGHPAASHGLHAHDLLHARCNASGCHLWELFASVRGATASRMRVRADLADRLLGREMEIYLRRIDRADGRGRTGGPGTLMTVRDGTMRGYRSETPAWAAADPGAALAWCAELTRPAVCSQVLLGHEKERQRLANEFHDGIGQSLAAVKYRVESVGRLLKDGEVGKGIAALDEVVTRMQGAIDEVRRIAMNLRPQILDDLGILPTIEWFCREFRSTYPEVRLLTDLQVREEDIVGDLKLVVYRVMQEALNNVARHASADEVRLEVHGDGGGLTLRIADNGRGFEFPIGADKPCGDGMGLSSMCQRVEQSNGRLRVESLRAVGTVVEAFWPQAAAGLSDQ